MIDIIQSESVRRRAELFLKTIYLPYIMYKMTEKTKRNVAYHNAMSASSSLDHPPFGSTQNMFARRTRFIPNPTEVGWF